MRFLHAADLHLDSPLSTMALRDPALGARLRGASRLALRRIVDLAIAEEVAAVLLAGDIFDSGVIDMAARVALVGELARLGRAGIRVALIWGNHDAGLSDDRHGPLGDHVHVLGRERPTLAFDGVAIHGIGFTEKHAKRSLLPDYPAPVPGVWNIGLMHTSLDGSRDHDPYAPCATADLLGHGFDYWALGHIHKRAEYANGRIVMAGIPQGRDIGEPGTGSVTLVEIGLDGVRAEARAVASMAFERVEIALEADATQTGRFERIAQAAEAARRADRETILRLVLRGPGAAPLLADAGGAQVMARAAMEAVEGVHLDKVEIVPGGAAPPVHELGDLAALMADEIAKPGFRDEIMAELAEWRRDLPPGLGRAMLDEGAFDDLAAEGVAAVLARLGTGAKGGA